jgi:hypothetical protein
VKTQSAPVNGVLPTANGKWASVGLTGMWLFDNSSGEWKKYEGNLQAEQQRKPVGW